MRRGRCGCIYRRLLSTLAFAVAGAMPWWFVDRRYVLTFTCPRACLCGLDMLLIYLEAPDGERRSSVCQTHIVDIDESVCTLYYEYNGSAHRTVRSHTSSSPHPQLLLHLRVDVHGRTRFQSCENGVEMSA